MEEALEDRGLMISRSKTEYMRCTVSCAEVWGNGVVMQGENIKEVQSFKCLGSVVKQDGELDGGAEHQDTGRME